MKPDPTIPADELYQQFLQKRPSELRIYRRGGKDFPILFRVLTLTENEACKMRALKYFKAAGIDKNDDPSMYADRVACEVLNMACREPEEDSNGINHGFFKKGVADITDQLTSDELAQLFEIYKQVQYRLGPWERSVNANELDSWINRLGTGALDANFLIRWDYYQLAELVEMLAERCHSLHTQLPDSPYFLAYLLENSDSGITSLTEGQSEGSMNETQPRETVEFGETSKGLSKVFQSEMTSKPMPAKMTLNTLEETKALAAKLRNK